MNDLINRQDAIDALGEEPLVWDENDDYDVATRNQWRYDIECIKEVPTAQPKKGKWTIEDCHAATYKYCCSNCKAHHRAMYDFCPSCGADMRGDVNGD